MEIDFSGGRRKRFTKWLDANLAYIWLWFAAVGFGLLIFFSMISD